MQKQLEVYQLYKVYLADGRVGRVYSTSEKAVEDEINQWLKENQVTRDDVTLWTWAGYTTQAEKPANSFYAYRHHSRRLGLADQAGR
jgi:aryl-alcohol dehydrogenase-like predicted oxidoreductase